MNSFRYFIIIIFIFGVIDIISVQSQQLKEKEDGAIELMTEQPVNAINQFLKAGSTANLNSFYSVDPVMSWGHTQTWNNPQINFQPVGISTSVGDLDGDGTQDFIRVYNSWDERSEDPTARVNKTLVFLGSGDQVNHDFIIYDQLFPIGDVLGNGKSQLISESEDGITLYEFSSGSYTSNQVSIPELENLEISLSGVEIIRDDLDGNSVDDILISSGSMIYVGLMEDPLENSTVAALDISGHVNLPGEDISIQSLGHVNWDEVSYFVSTVRPSNDFQNYLAVFSFDPANSVIDLVQQELLTESANTTRIHLVEGDDGFPNVLAFGNSTDPENSGLFAKLFTKSNTAELYDEVPKDMGPVEAWPAGDLNGNGWSDLVVLADEIYNYATINTADTTLSLEGPIGYANDEGNPVMPYDFSPPGDLNGNGFDDFQYYHTNLYYQSNNIHFGQLRIEGVDVSGTVNYSNPVEYFYDADNYRVTSIDRTYGLGDVTGNGLDDYAMVIIDDLTRKLHVYEGGSNGQVPVHIIDVDGSTVYDLTSGNFNTQNREDILMLITLPIEVDGISQFTTKLHFYEMGADSPYNIITGQDYLPELDNYHNVIGTMANAGDVNNDGFDDVLVAAPGSNPDGLQPVGLYLGGPNMAVNPDVEISFPTDGINYNFGWGGTLQGNIDINGDGISDFIIGNSGEINLTDQPATPPYAIGEVHIFYGADGSSDFGPSDAQLIADTTADQSVNYQFFGLNEIGVGDFNGDGNMDIAAKPFFHVMNNDFSMGAPAIHIYEGGEGFNGLPDQVIPLLKEIHTPNAVGQGNDYTSASGRALISTVPDINGDGSDELLYIGNSGETNGSLFFGGNSFSNQPDAVLKAPNQSLPLNRNGNFINRQYRMTIGEFTAPGVTSVIVEQPGDTRFRDTPAYMFDLTEMNVSTEEQVSDVPQSYRLEQNYPNPFNPTTDIRFTIPEASQVTLTVYNVIGQQVATVVNEFKQAGTHTVAFDAEQLSSGMYIYQLKTGSVQLNRKMMLVK